MPLVSRYNVAEVVVAIATPDGKAFRVVRVTPTTRVPSTFAYAQPNYAAVTQAIMDGVNEAWKTRPIVVATRATLIADVAFASSEDWSKIRAQLGAVKSIAGLSVRGLMLHEAEIELSYFGRPEQLQAALAQQNLSLVGTQGNYTLELGGNTANAQ
jgi:hypothetical protein